MFRSRTVLSVTALALVIGLGSSALGLCFLCLSYRPAIKQMLADNEILGT